MRILYERPIQLTPASMAARTQRPFICQPRSRGVHVQAINRALGVAAGKLDDSDGDDYPFERFSDTCYPLMPALGVAWEEFRASHYSESELLWQPGELERDGIFGNPDGLYIPEPQVALWECKETTKKAQRIDSCWMYMKQGLSYCAMSGQTRVLYDICWLLGDYSRPYKPVGTTTLVEFEERECESWWTILKREAKNVKSE